MRIESHERSTGMGATKYTAILVGRGWVKVSQMKDCKYHGRKTGIEHYSCEVPSHSFSADFRRSNSGKERVFIYQDGKPVEDFFSFDDAHRWASSNGIEEKPKAVRLMNSAMMPADGHYERTTLSKEEFGMRVKTAFLGGQLVSYIGYPQTAEIISQLANVRIPVNRAETVLEDGDTILVARLTYRVNPNEKGREVNEDDFEYLAVSHSKGESK